MGYLDHLRNEVHFDPESTFREKAHRQTSNNTAEFMLLLDLEP